jgi:hypothetical protein
MITLVYALNATYSYDNFCYCTPLGLSTSYIMSKTSSSLGGKPVHEFERSMFHFYPGQRVDSMIILKWTR